MKINSRPITILINRTMKVYFLLPANDRSVSIVAQPLDVNDFDIRSRTLMRQSDVRTHVLRGHLFSQINPVVDCVLSILCICKNKV